MVFRAFAFNASSTGNSLRVDTARVINGSGKFAAWFHGHDTTGTVYLGNISSDVAPSVGITSNIGSLDSYTLAGVPNSQIGSAAPTTGTWARGDIVWDDTPSASGKIGWVCTAAGTPGTWNAWGAIDA
jgi:hypothetical protein